MAEISAAMLDLACRGCTLDFHVNNDDGDLLDEESKVVGGVGEDEMAKLYPVVDR